MQAGLATRWTALAAIGAVVYVNASRAMRGMPPAAATGWNAWLLAIATIGFAFLALQKSFWMPELGPTQLPPHVLQFDRAPTAGMTVATDAAATISVADPRAVGVVYYAAEPAPSMTIFDDAHKPDATFETMSNGGVARVVNGQATMSFRCPRRTKIAGMFFLPKRVHYRVVYTDGRLSAVKTFEVAC